MDLSSDINAAVDAATAPPSPPATPASTPAVPASTATPVEKPLTSTPAPRSGLDRRSTRAADSGGKPTAQAAPASTASTTAETYSVPPRAEWEGILENARTKAADAARTEVLARYAGVTPELWDSHIRSYVEGLQNNPVAFHRWLGEQLTARGLTVAEDPPAPEPLTMPQPSLYADAGNGRQIPAYSADDVQQALRVAHAQWSAQLDQRLGPLEQTARDARVSSLAAEADRHAQQILAEAKTLPHFEELVEDIAAIMARDKRYSVEGAYARALREKMPALDARKRQAVLAELDKAPAAATAIDPSRPVIAGTQRTKGLTLDQRFEQELEKAMSAR